jgi:hypothetical protein
MAVRRHHCRTARVRVLGSQLGSQGLTPSMSWAASAWTALRGTWTDPAHGKITPGRVAGDLVGERRRPATLDGGAGSCLPQLPGAPAVRHHPAGRDHPTRRASLGRSADRPRVRARHCRQGLPAARAHAHGGRQRRHDPSFALPGGPAAQGGGPRPAVHRPTQDQSRAAHHRAATGSGGGVGCSLGAGRPRRRVRVHRREGRRASHLELPHQGVLPAVRAAGPAPLRPHDLRHTAVALWIAGGANPRRSASGPGTLPSASRWTATATCSRVTTPSCATAWTPCTLKGCRAR